MLVAFGLVGSVSAIDINDNLSINGFIDGSFSSTDSRTAAGVSSDTTELGLDEIEIDFLFNAGGVSGELHIDDDGSNNALDIEQAHLSYGFEGGLTLTAGKFGSALGLDGQDPAGLFAYSRAYSNDDFQLGDVDNHPQEGLRLSYSADQFSVSVSAVNADNSEEENGGAIHAVNNPLGDREDDLDWEVAIAFTGIENLSIGGGLLVSNAATTISTGAPHVAGTEDTSIFNIHAGYTMGKALIAGEWSTIDSDVANTADLDAYQILVDYDVSDVLGIVVRYTEEDDSATADTDSFTIAPNYAISDNLGAIVEYTNINDSTGADEDFLAVELTFTF